MIVLVSGCGARTALEVDPLPPCDTDAGVLASGQVAGVIDDLPTCEELIDRIVLRAVDEIRRSGTYLT